MPLQKHSKCFLTLKKPFLSNSVTVSTGDILEVPKATLIFRIITERVIIFYQKFIGVYQTSRKKRRFPKWNLQEKYKIKKIYKSHRKRHTCRFLVDKKMACHDIVVEFFWKFLHEVDEVCVVGDEFFNSFELLLLLSNSIMHTLRCFLRVFGGKH